MAFIKIKMVEFEEVKEIILNTDSICDIYRGVDGSYCADLSDGNNLEIYSKEDAQKIFQAIGVSLDSTVFYMNLTKYHFRLIRFIFM